MPRPNPEVIGKLDNVRGISAYAGGGIRLRTHHRQTADLKLKVMGKGGTNRFGPSGAGL